MQRNPICTARAAALHITEEQGRQEVIAAKKKHEKEVRSKIKRTLIANRWAGSPTPELFQIYPDGHSEISQDRLHDIYREEEGKFEAY